MAPMNRVRLPAPSMPSVLMLSVLMAVALAACGRPSPSPTPAGTSVEPSPTGTVPAPASPSGTADATPDVTTPPVAADPPALALEPVATGLAEPIGIATAPDGWLLVQERAGRLVAVPPDGGEPRLAADLTDRVLGEGERGLLGIALHPRFPDDPRTFVHYTDRAGNTVVSTFNAAVDADGAPTLDPASEDPLLAVQQPYANHNGGQLAFGPDGMLYLGLGDGGSGGDPHGNAQNPATLLGKILRIDVDRPPQGRDGPAYGIPEDTPFAQGGGAPEVFLIGLRNPWRFSFDRDTEQLWIADVGQNAFEEVNRVDLASAAGANLGWNVMEATHCFASEDCSSDGLVLPLVEYAHDLGCSVTGGHVYRGSGIAGLAGWYLFSDYCSGTLFGVPSDAAGSGLAPRALLETGGSVTSFGEASDGELYLTDIGGTLYRVVAG
jgi:glucose/arabinose dehydrogenase